MLEAKLAYLSMTSVFFLIFKLGITGEVGSDDTEGPGIFPGMYK